MATVVQRIDRGAERADHFQRRNEPADRAATVVHMPEQSSEAGDEDSLAPDSVGPMKRLLNFRDAANDRLPAKDLSRARGLILLSCVCLLVGFLLGPNLGGTVVFNASWLPLALGSYIFWRPRAKETETPV